MVRRWCRWLPVACRTTGPASPRLPPVVSSNKSRSSRSYRRNHSRNRSRGSSSSKAATCVVEAADAGHPVACKDIASAVQAFRTCGAEALARECIFEEAAQWQSPASWEPLWSAAGDFVEALLLGVLAHLPELRPAVSVWEGGRVRREGAGGGQSEDEVLVSLAVDFGPTPVVGEVATLSRFTQEVRLRGELRFALLRCQSPRGTPPIGGSGRLQPQRRRLAMYVSGLEMPALDDLSALRQRLQCDLGQETLNREAAYHWWLQHRHADFPLETSKFNRIWESLFGQPALKVLPKQVHMDSLWGWLHNPGCDLRLFCFEAAGARGRVTLTAERAPAKSAEEARLLEVCREISTRVLTENRAAGERFAASTTNFCAMLYAAEVDQVGGCAATIVKMFSAAKWWGPGKLGWQQFDETALCKDRRNSCGFLAEEQGRIIWRLAADIAAGGRRPRGAGREARRSEVQMPSRSMKRSTLFGCCRRNKFAEK
mmetsp:Transcript_105380/g.265449  ORF Transcript_105380/g.265449 Transcript_105380/m.265449 type:complete len:485 (+) Transcript_105380:174-1628(+)